MKVSTASFTYRKADGSVSQRKLLVLSHPTEDYFGVEYSDPDLTDVANVLDYLAEKAQFEEYLKTKYHLADVKYRRFKGNGVTNLVESKLNI